MRTGALREAHLSWMVPRLLLLLLLSLCTCAAPGVPEVQSEGNENIAPMANPFGSGEEDRRLLSKFIKIKLESHTGPEIDSWEQEVFFLFRLYDFDHSGVLDGLEMMKLLLDMNADEDLGTNANKKVESMVDFLLLRHDANMDGQLGPSELLTSPLTRKETEVHVQPPQQDHQVEAEVQEKLHEEENVVVEEEEHHQEDVLQPEEEQVGLETHNDHEQQVPVHQGQPEM